VSRGEQEKGQKGTEKEISKKRIGGRRSQFFHSRTGARISFIPNFVIRVR
jgi:hypothetical protein